jgi:hypothetical protein
VSVGKKLRNEGKEEKCTREYERCKSIRFAPRPRLARGTLRSSDQGTLTCSKNERERSLTKEKTRKTTTEFRRLVSTMQNNDKALVG